LSGLGFCLTLGVGCCMATALVFLPALLHCLTPGRAEAPAPSVKVYSARQAA
jgi:predicted RND superfamily exporter protein